MNKILGAGAAALMTVTVLAGCGGSDSGGSNGYCDDIQTASNQLSGLGGSDFTADKFDAVNSAVHNIAGEAPSEIKSQWTLVADEFDALTQALSDAGISMDDFSKLSQSGTPPSIDPSKLQALETALKDFDATGLSAAASKIQTQVKSDCNIDLKTAN